MILGLNWSILIIFLALGVIGIWVAYSFLNKNGLYLFCLVASILAFTVGSAKVFNLEISISTVIMPIIYFALLTALNKYGKDEAKRLFFVTLTAMASLFVCVFFQAAYADSAFKTYGFLTWDYLGGFLTPILAFVVASAVTLFLTSKIKIKQLKNFLKLGMFIAIASCIDVLVYVLLVFVGALSFGNILLIVLIKFILSAIIALGLGYFEKFLNREPKAVQEEEKVKEAPKQEVKEENEEIKTPDDID